MEVRSKGTGRVGRRHTRAVEAGAAGRQGLRNRWMALAVVIAALALAAAPIASAREFSPYVLMADPLPANPASRPGHFLVIGAGPVAGEIQSTNWNAGQVAQFIEAVLDENAKFPENLPAGLGEFRTGIAARASFTIFGVDLTYAPMMLTATGFLSDDLVEALRARREERAPSRDIDLQGGIQLIAWQEVAVRAALGVPVLPRLLGLRSLVVGGSVHWMQGHGAVDGNARGTFRAGVESSAEVEAVTADRGGTGLAYDVGFMAELSRWLSVEGAYVGVGQLKWAEAKKEVWGWDKFGNSVDKEPETVSLAYDLPASTLLALRVRPVGPIELLLGYARIGVNKPDGFGRLNGELTLRLPVVQPSIGMVQDEGEPIYLYGKLRVGFRGTAITVKAVNVEALANPEKEKTFGLAASLSLGF